AAAINQDWAGQPALELRHFRGHITTDDGAIVPVGMLQRARDDVLGHVVYLLGEAIAAPARPGGSETFVRRAAQQQRLGGRKLVHFEPVAFWPALELKCPTASRQALRAAGVLHHTVQRDEL